MPKRWASVAVISGIVLSVLAIVVGGLAFLEQRSSPADYGATTADSYGAGRPGGTAKPAPGSSLTSTPTSRPTAAPSATKTKPAKTATTPPRITGARPGPPNTGVPAGTKLTSVSGDLTYSRDNQVISGLDIHGAVVVTGKHVTIKNSILRGGQPRCNSAVLHIENGASATIVDSEITAAHPSPCVDGVWAQSTTLTRVNIHGVVDGVKAFDNVVLQDSYVHDLSYFASDPNQGGGPTHNDAVQTYVGNQHITLRRNNLALTDRDNAAYQVTQDGGGRSTDLHIENNWLDGGGCTLNFAHKGGPTPMTGIYVVGNRFGRNSYYDCPILLSTQSMLTQNSGNVWDNTGSPIPAPQRHD